MRILPLLSLLLAAAPLTAQTGTPDQQSPFGNASFNMDATSLTWQQQIRAGIAGTLEGIHVKLNSPAGSPGTVNVSIRLGGGWSGGAVLWSGTANTVGLGAMEDVFIDVSSAGINLAANDLYVMELQGTGTGVWMQGSYVAPPGTPLYPEPLFLNQNPYPAGWLLGFETFMLTGPPPPTLTVTGSCPGTGTVSLANMTPNGVVAIAIATATGPSVVGGGNCAGAQIGLLNPQLRVVAAADGSGNLLLNGVNLPAAACGTYHAQGFDVATCTGTNVVDL